MNNRKRLLIYSFQSLLCLMFFASDAIAQSISGSVTDKKTGEALIGATVVIEGKNTGTTVDVNGKFTLVNPGSLPLVLRFSFLGYTPTSLEVRSYTQKIDIKLAESEKVIGTLEVFDSRLTEKQRESALTVEALDLLAIKETPAANFYDGLGALKGVDLTAASLGFKVINTRGFNSTSPVRSLQIIDGVDNQAPGLNFSLGNFLGSSELDVQKVDIIVGASSAFYGPNAFNGVISMTTKSPFDYTGLTVQAKVGERNLYETAVRWAQKFKLGSSEVDNLAYKVNLSYMRANDWEATNMAPTEQSLTEENNPGGYDAVNRYGDEELGGFQFNYAKSAQDKSTYPGLGVIYRDGYRETDIVDYRTNNLKLNGALHYRLRNKTEIILTSNFGTGNTIYQGENRFALRNILFFQNKFEIQKQDKFFIRVYATNESAGNSYDAVVTAFEMQNLVKSNNQWKEDYLFNWTAGGFNAPRFKIKSLPGYPIPFNERIYDSLMVVYVDTLNKYHEIVRERANNGYTGLSYLEPGTASFDSVLAVINGRLLSEQGSRLSDFSALYHVHGEYRFTIGKHLKVTSGANGRLYRPNSNGTIFSDTLVIDRIENNDTTYKRRVITNKEMGIYSGLQYSLFEESLKLNASVRVDKNQNFNWISTQSGSAVYTLRDKHTFRAVFSSAIRNPTLQDQYLYYNVGRAILIGNIEGRDSLITISSFVDYMNTLNAQKLRYFNVDPIRPEEVKTIELGYRGTLFQKLFVDLSYYSSVYTNFIGFKIGLEYEPNFAAPRVQAYRVASNTKDKLYSQGFSAGLNYYINDELMFMGNYSWNRLSRPDSTDEIITAFNTPEHKFNLGVNGRGIKLPFIKGKNFGFQINYKWVEGFEFTGSPQFTGSIPSYALVDAQINWTISKWHTVAKLGASNALDNRVFLVYGGPQIGRLGYFSITVDLD